MTDTCSKHSFEIAAGVCRQCKNSYCSECLVYSFGPKKPPYCVACALNAAGIRRKGAATNPRLRKKGIFGRQVMVDEEPRRELGFDEINIELPDQYETAPVVARATRREAAPDLVAAVTAADTAADSSHTAVLTASEDLDHTDDSPGLLADWASSLDVPGDDGPSSGIAAWPEFESDGGASF